MNDRGRQVAGQGSTVFAIHTNKRITQAAKSRCVVRGISTSTTLHVETGFKLEQTLEAVSKIFRTLETEQ